MQFGVCGGPAMADTAAGLGFDYAEWSVPALLMPREPETAFRAALQQAQAAALPYPVVNCFVPGDLKITGPDVDPQALRVYVTTAMHRARQAGVEVIVFGSGGARQIPEGFDRQRAHAQIVEFCRMTAPLAHDNGVTVVVEPLNRSECNVLNTVAEGAALVREVDHPGLRLLVDGYHLLKDQDACESIVAHGALLAHTHVATIPDRRAPGVEACELQSFFAALSAAGYTGRMSIEGRIDDASTELGIGLAAMRELAGR